MTASLFKGVALGWAVLIAVLSLMPGDMAPHSGLGDKFEHMMGYVGLSFLISAGWNRIPRAFVLAVAFGITIELLQSLTPDRTMDFWDAVANSIGAGLGCFLYSLLVRRRLVTVRR
ncbi:VanZ family protein [Aestuariispira ectoiniformans]|uniref:VanZ family protein n=1 Tax=Aestuariispira ectoiniformans TaxID=2775080 RepID=UPI00223ACACC|nr:VanZ family protein [Aestuariispira ectoiniformans]